MIINCSQCHASYDLPEDKIGDKDVKTKCPKCGESIIITPSAPEITPVDLMKSIEAEKTTATEEGLYNESPEPEENLDDAEGMEPEGSIGMYFPFEESQPEEPFVAPVRVARKDADSSTIAAEILETIKLSFPQHQEVFSKRIHFRETLQPNYLTRENTFKMKILAAVAPKLQQLLHAQEYVCRIGQGYAHYPLELFFGYGFFTRMYNNYAIICTERRIIFCNISSRNTRTTHYYFQMYYSEIQEVEQSFFGRNITFITKLGRKRIFKNVKKYISAELVEFIQGKLGQEEATVTTGLLEDLCPSCCSPLEQGLEYCPSCEVEFKRPAHALIRSLILPGLGDIYLGHHLLGSLEIFGALAMWVVLIKSFLMFLNNGKILPMAAAVVLLIVYNGVDAFLDWSMAKKGYMLAN